MLSKRRPTAPLQLPSWVTSVETPLVVSEWQRLLQQHPDEVYRRYVLDGIQHGSVLASDIGTRLNYPARLRTGNYAHAY